jgi:hypothetical protein
MGVPPRYAIAKQPRKRGKGWHWVLLWERTRYDPAGTDSASYGPRLLSYLPLTPRSE